MHPIGPLATFGPMIVAWGRAHWGRPIWVTSGGAELPATNIAIATALVLTGPGAISLDRLFGIRIPTALSVLVAACIAGGAATALMQPHRTEQEQPRIEEATEPQPAGSTL
jgi:putative oxidoreductase